ncbi:MAG: PD40 domain-containing protein [Balneolaceae bacterium]|nr:PD40 domain-containing protein [Balneolaceae bacterium]MCH8550013.1 peptidase S41 [Balneolaceae bacterium]
MRTLSALLSLLFISLLSLQLSAQSSTPWFTSHPTLTPDGETIIFSFETDLWKVPTAGGQAVRITAMDGMETRPAVSPDGEWLSFSSTQYGNMDLYVMPLEGGEIERLTWHQAADEAEGWSWDSQSIYFTSARENRFSSWKVSREGGTPERLFQHYHVTDHNLAAHPEGYYLFNTSWESKNQAHRKRYRGAFAPQIESWHPGSEEYSVLTDHDGKDMWPSVDENGVIYFVSDEYNGEYNLYRILGGEKEQLTSFDTSIKHPRVSANGEKVVFTRDYQIWLFDVASGEAGRVEFSVFGNSTLEKEQDFRVQGSITEFDASPDKKKLAFVSRGELFVSDAEGKFIRQLSTAADGRVMEVKWLADNRTLIFSQTWNGYQNWHTISAEGNGAEERITEDLQNNRSLSLNSDRSSGVYLSGRGEVRIIDMESMESRTVVEDEIWDIFSSAPSFSPDDRFILFTSFRNFEQSLFVHDLEEDRTIAITDTYVSETDPVWSPDGKYIYFQTNRTEPSFPYGMRDSDIYRIALVDIQPEFRSDRVDRLFSDDNDEDGNGEESVTVVIEEERLRDRWEHVGPGFGSQSSPYVFIDDEKTYVLYRSDHDQGRNAWWKTVFEPFEAPVTEMIAGTQMGSGSIVEVDGSHWVLLGGDIHQLNISGSSVEKVEAEYTFRRNLRDEFNQMFDEMWANLETNFYESDFHGIDWEEVREHYRQFLPHVRTRADLREMKNDMLGELNTSHIGFSSSGGEEQVFHGSTTLATGILFEADDPYVVKRTVRNSPAFKSATAPEPGDRLIRVKGNEVDPGKNRESYFSFPSSMNEITLTFRRDNSEFDLKLEPVSYFAVRNLLYDEWMLERQQIVDEQSDKRVAYVHMKNMGQGELEHFKQEMVQQGEERDALILDLRYNTGGNVHDEVLRFLSQRPYLKWGYREGQLASQSNFTPSAKPIVLLINEQSLSDAEMTAAGFKELGLGTVMGMETYRWIIFTSGRSLVDGSSYRLPSWGVYTFEGDNLEFTGVAPDIEIPKTFDDRVRDRDPQLERAIRYILEKL